MDEDPEDPWSLVRLALGSLAGESWRLKQAFREMSKAWRLRTPRSTWWKEYQQTQTFDQFKCAVPFRPNTVSSIQVAIVGDEELVARQMSLEQILKHVEVFMGFKVIQRGGLENPMPRMRLSAAGQRTSVDGVPQIGAHYVLAFLQGFVDPRAACTLAITPVDLYPPQHYDYVTGMTDPGDRLGLYSSARYFASHHEDGSSDTGTLELGVSTSTAMVRSRRLELSKAFAKLLCRESLKLCGAQECSLLYCLMNPLPETDGHVPEAIAQLPFSLCCICLRKLQWLSQVDLLDRYSRIPPIINSWFFEETQWLWERMVQVGMPTAVCLSTPDPTGLKFKFGVPKRGQKQDREDAAT
ncbi:unnamed protein product [Durusdinium trenchii]|uniref:Archaemetzincin-2 (Archeobacterial metalloproteinase-like protein 2) n=2 Tax=Durusdinium trenchii TaxID=1381693 RepID=A0ABP0KCF8_9DINO